MSNHNMNLKFQHFSFIQNIVIKFNQEEVSWQYFTPTMLLKAGDMTVMIITGIM